MDKDKKSKGTLLKWEDPKLVKLNKAEQAEGEDQIYIPPRPN